MTAFLGALELPFCKADVGAVSSSMKDLEFPGVDGIGRLDMGRRIRTISITGFLPDAIGGATKGSDIEGLDTSTTYTFTTGVGGRSFLYCQVVDARTFGWSKAIGTGGEKQTCEYSIELEQLRE